MRRSVGHWGVALGVLLAIVPVGVANAAPVAHASTFARNVTVYSTSTAHVSPPNYVYSGRITETKVVAGIGGGSVPHPLALAAESACFQVYAKGYHGYVFHVQLLWNQTLQTGATLVTANYGYQPSVFHGAGYWSTNGIGGPSIMKGDKFLISGGIVGPFGSLLTDVPATVLYRHSAVKVACLPFNIVKHWPF